MSRPRALLLAPGASADRNQPALVAVDQAVSAAGLVVARMDFQGRVGRKAAVLIQAVVDEAAALAAAAGCAAEEIALGGRSMGGRMCSMAVAEGQPAAALVLISYPLHAPGRAEWRTAHFPLLAVPCLFVSGTRDAFGTPDELTGAAAAIAGPVTHRWLEGQGHGL
jgi:hypothetical protein